MYSTFSANPTFLSLSLAHSIPFNYNHMPTLSQRIITTAYCITEERPPSRWHQQQQQQHHHQTHCTLKHNTCPKSNAAPCLCPPSDPLTEKHPALSDWGRCMDERTPRDAPIVITSIVANCCRAYGYIFSGFGLSFWSVSGGIFWGLNKATQSLTCARVWDTFGLIVLSVPNTNSRPLAHYAVIQAAHVTQHNC